MIKYKVFILVLASLFFGYSPPANAANVYLGPDSACSASATGADWTNCKRFTEIAADGWGRGNTYYLQEGTYGSLTVTTPNSDSSRITFKKCGANGQTQYGSGDGTCEAASGFISGEHDGQATFGAFSITAGYVTVDGVTGGGPGASIATSDWECDKCGLYFYGTSVVGSASDSNSDSIILQHLEVDAGQTTSSTVRAMEIWRSNDLTMQYVYIHDAGCDLLSGGGVNDMLVQYSKLARPRQGDGESCHGDGFEHQNYDSTNIVFKWNFFEDMVGSYCFGTHQATITGYEVYGNIFWWNANLYSTVYFGNGFIGDIGGVVSGFKFYNNTLIGPFTNGTVNDSGTIGCAVNESGASCSAINNIWDRRLAASTENGSGFHVGLGSPESGNTCYDQGSDCDQNLTGDGPFTDYTNKNLSLTAASTAGTTLSSPYNTDMYGNIRGADGVWDRGALEYGTGSGGGVGTISNITIGPGVSVR